LGITKQSNKASGAILLIAATFIGYKAYQIYAGNFAFPTKCTGRGALFCELGNFIFAQLGLPAVFMATFAISLMLLSLAYLYLTPEKNVD
jgi:hypothetical protein